MQAVHASLVPRVTLAALLLGVNILSEFCWAQGAGDGSDGGDGPDYVYDEYDAEGPATVTTGEEGDVRLVSRVDVNGYATGALQVFCEGAWGGVCNSNFGNSDALVACRQLGFPTGVALTPNAPPPRTTRTFPDEEVLVPLAVENLGCSGSESRLLDCPVEMLTLTEVQSSTSSLNRRACSPFSNTYAFVACGALTSQEEGDARLVDGATGEDDSAEYGRLEVFFRGGWGTVCMPNRGIFSDGGMAVLNVACRSLGFSGAQIVTPLAIQNPPDPLIPVHVSGVECNGDEDSLMDCPSFELGASRSQCDPGDIVDALCFDRAAGLAVNRGLRLSDGQSGPGYEYGRLEALRRGFWGNFCGVLGFPPESAKVACTLLGYDGGAPLRLPVPYQGESVNQVLVEFLPVSMAGVQCDGGEAGILDCESTAPADNGFVREQCDEVLDKGITSTVIACANSAPGCGQVAEAQEGSVRLVGGFGTLCDPLHSGFTEVFHDGEWGAICLEPFSGSTNPPEDRLVADVVCRQLGFPHGTLVIPREAGSADGPNLARSWLSDVQCRGPEATVAECRGGEDFLTGAAECERASSFREATISNQLYVACRQFPVIEALEGEVTPGAGEGDLRLVNEERVDNWVTGGLQIFLDGAWGQVCRGLFQGRDADVACRQLGFGAGTQVVFDPSDYGDYDTEGTPEVALTSVGCTGTEATLLECAADADVARLGMRRCASSTEPGLKLACVVSAAAGEEGAVRLANREDGDVPGAATGFLEIFHAGAWGTLCAGTVTEGDYYLESESLEGYEGGGTDPPIFSREAPQVSCRQLGFEAGEFDSIFAVATVPALSPPWLSSLNCVGSEATVAECGRSEFGNTWSCRESRGPRLSCFNTRESTGRDIQTSAIRLVGGSADMSGQWEYGRLEVLIDGFWTALDEQTSADNFGRRGAQVACETLGYATGAQLLAGAASALPSFSYEPALRRSADCDGSEDSFSDCSLDYDGYFRVQGNVDGSSVDDVALVCVNPSGCTTQPRGPPAEGDVRLVPLNGTSPPTAACDAVHFGGVEIFHDGLWGRICSGDAPYDFTLDADVVCRQLGFPFGGLLDVEESFSSDYYTDNRYDYVSEVGDQALVWATQVVCTGREDQLSDCVFPEEFGDAVSTGNPDSASGLSAGCGARDGEIFGVVCRRFDLTESDVIRR